MNKTRELNLETMIENMLKGWERTSNGEWERFTKGSKTRYMENTYENKGKNLVLNERIKEDKRGCLFTIDYEIFKGNLKLNKDLGDFKRRSVQKLTFSWFQEWKRTWCNS